MANERTCFHSRRRIQHTAYLFLSLESCSSHLLYPPNAAGELLIDIHGARSSPFNAKRKIRRNSRYLSPPLSLHKVICEANVDSSRLNRGVGLALRSLFTLSSVCMHPGHVISRDQKYTLMRWRKFAPAASHFDGRDFAVRLRYQFARVSRFEGCSSHSTMRIDLSGFFFVLRQIGYWPHNSIFNVKLIIESCVSSGLI